MGHSWKYEKIADALREGIQKGQFPAGAALPNEWDLVREHHTNRKTARSALKIIVNEGLAERRGEDLIVLEAPAPVMAVEFTPDHIRVLLSMLPQFEDKSIAGYSLRDRRTLFDAHLRLRAALKRWTG